MTKRALIKGMVEYREGDGATIAIPEGPIEVEVSEIDVTISWSDGDTHGSTAMPKTDFDMYVDSQAIEVLE